MFLGPFSQCQRDKFRAVNHTKHGRIATVCREPVEYTDHSLIWLIQIDFNRQRLTVKVINGIERAKITATDQGIMNIIDRPVLVQRFPSGQWRGITHRQPLFCDSPGFPGASEPGRVSENRIVDIALPLPATRQ